jgi:hypothetical protein
VGMEDVLDALTDRSPGGDHLKGAYEARFLAALEFGNIVGSRLHHTPL